MTNKESVQKNAGRFDYRRIRILILFFLILFPVLFSPLTHATGNVIFDPLGSFKGTGSTPVYWSGNEKINNTSFENGNYLPWTPNSYNANMSSITIVSPGQGDSHSVQLSITSGNLTSGSYQRLTQDLTSAQAGFSNNTLLEAAVQVTALTGNSSSDRAGVIVSLASSTGSTVRLHYVFASGAGLPSNTTTDAYFKVAGFGSLGWIIVTRNLASDAQASFPALASSIDAAKDVSLYVDSMSYPRPNRDPKIKFFDHYGNGVWNSSETVVYDPDNDGHYALGDPLLFNATWTPSVGSALVNDPLIKFVDTNMNGAWDTGEPIVYDCGNTIPGDCNNNAVDVNEPVISGNPIIGQLLADPIRRTTTAEFDQIQLFSPSSNGNIVINGGFETGTLSSWGNTAGFSISTAAHTGSHSAFGTATGAVAQLAQSIDSQPRINSQTILSASAYMTSLTGTSASDMIDIWLGLSDSKGTPVSLFYIFAAGTLPSNATGSIYYKAPGYGTLNQWNVLNRTLLQDTATFNSQGFSSPYSLNLVVLEAKAQGSNTSSAYYDDISISGTNTPSGYAPSSFAAMSGQNATYTYTVSNLQSGQFSIQVPAGQSVLNITSPSLSLLQQSDYTVTQVGPVNLIFIPNSTVTRYAIGGTYHLFTTIRNAVSSIYAQDASSLSILNFTSSLTPAKRVQLVELSLDPFSTPIAGANSTISVWSNNGTMLNQWTGTSDSLGFFRVRNIALPTADGTYTLQATSYSTSGVGIRDRQFTIVTPSVPGPFSPLVIALIIIATIASITVFLIYYRRRKPSVVATTNTPSNKSKKNAGQKKKNKF